jgi:hypothetical protein
MRERLYPLRRLTLIAAGTPFLAAFPLPARPAMAEDQRQPQPRGYSLPLIDLARETERRVMVDREAGQYLGHPSTVLLMEELDKKAEHGAARGDVR